MKLKYYMRGLGIGIVLTTLILTIARPNEKMSDQDIKRRATELGMVMENEDNENLDKVLEEILPSGLPTPLPSGSVTPEPTIQPTIQPTIGPTVEPTIEPTVEPTAEPIVKPSPTNIPTEVVDQNGSDNAKITFTIKSGMSSGQVAKMLVEKGLIEDADDFNKFIVKNGKAGVIRVGTYTVNKDASYKDIIDNITK
jgi:hypothetical protein